MGPIKLACIPGAFLALVELALRWAFPDGRFHAFSFLVDWCNNIHFVTVYFLGYAIMSGDSAGFGEILKRCRWWYLVIGTILILIFYVPIALLLHPYPLINYPLTCIFRGFGEWMFMLGLYAVYRNIFTKHFKIIKILREMAMPFYLLHQQVLIALVSGTLWIPYLGSFIATIILSTLGTCIISFLVVKSPGPIKYFFGLPSNHWIVPGKKLAGFIPLILLCITVVMLTIIANVIVLFI